jgi:hypothetical protein
METNQTELTLSKSALKRLKAQEHNKNYVPSPDLPRLTAEQVEELERLSKEVFNSTSRYKTLMTKGERVPLTDTVTEYVPAEDGGEGTTKEVEVPVNYKNSHKSVVYKVVKYTYKSVKAHMLDLKARQERVRELIAKMEADKKAAQEKAQKDKEEAFAKQKALEDLGGSAV